MIDVAVVKIDGVEYEMWDDTKLKSYACETKGQLEHEEHLIPKEPSEAIAFGQSMHKAVEVWTQQAGIDKVDDAIAVANAEAAAEREWNAMLPPETVMMLEMSENRRSMRNLKRLFGGLRKKYPLAMYDKIIEVEKPFALPLGTTVHGVRIAWCGKRDRVLGWQEGIYYTDIKTSSFALDEAFFNQWKRSGQLMGYHWSGQEQLGMKFSGVIVQGVQVQAPLKTKVRLPEELIQTEVIPFTEEQIERWRENVLTKIDDVHRARERGVYTMNDGELCKGYRSSCAMAKICNAMPDAREYVKEQFYRRRKWNPLDNQEAGD